MRDNDNGEFYPVPATFECRICKEVCNDMTFDQTADTCDDCQNRLALREIEGSEKR